MQRAKTVDRLPLSMEEWTDRLKWSGGSSDPKASLDKVTVAPDVVEDFRSLSSSLEWRVSEHYWSTAGVLPFAENEVPFVVNNSGRLSENAAVVLFAACEESKPQGEIRVLELGAGTGLFAQLFLNAFRAVCAQEKGADYYERLTYVVTDRSPATIAHWRERRLFSDHRAHVHMQTCDAAELQGACVEPVHAVFCNYILDVLPSAVVRRGPAGGLEQLCVRTRMQADPVLKKLYSCPPLEEIRRMAASDDVSRLLPLMSLFDYELTFLADGAADLPYVEEALRWNPGLPRILLNFGALTCLSKCHRLLSPGGFILLNDYGPVKAAQVSEHSSTQRFGSTTATGLNFPFVEYFFGARGVTVHKPGGDDERALHSRLITGATAQAAAEAFLNRFSADAWDYFEIPVKQAREHAAAGRKSEALDCYRTALTRNPHEWTLIGEAAEFVSEQLRDYAAAVELCRAALELNPVYCAWLWNVLGDALYCQERYADAHEAYLQAERIDPDDGRTNLNLAYTFLQDGNIADCLRVIARGLAADRRGAFCDRLLEKQQQAIHAICSRWAGEQDRLALRTARFSSTA